MSGQPTQPPRPQVSSLNLSDGIFGPKARFPADSSKICYSRVLIVGFKSPYSKSGRLGPNFHHFFKIQKLAACTQSLSAMCNPTTWLDLSFDTARMDFNDPILMSKTTRSSLPMEIISLSHPKDISKTWTMTFFFDLGRLGSGANLLCPKSYLLL